MLYVNNSVFFLYSLRSPYGNITSGTQTETECHQGGGRCVFRVQSQSQSQGAQDQLVSQRKYYLLTS